MYACTLYIITWQREVRLIYMHDPEDAQCPRESADIPVNPRARPCYKIYVTLSLVVYSIAHNYQRQTTLHARYNVVRRYHIRRSHVSDAEKNTR